MRTEIVWQKAISTKYGGRPFQVWGPIVCNIVEQKTSRIKAMLTAEKNRDIDLWQGSILYFFFSLHAQRCVWS